MMLFNDVLEMGNMIIMANRIIALVENEDLRKCMGKESIRVSRKYKPESFLSQWKDLYNHLS